MEDNNYLAKEIITVLNNFQEEFVEKIPKDIIEAFTELSKKCTKTVELDMNKKLIEQDVSDECKDFIAVMYYNYIADENQKNYLVKKWCENEKR